jgi:Bacterial virulence factor lipase N-terminal
MKRSYRHLVAIVILTVLFPVLGTVQGPSGWGGLVASADRPPHGFVHALFDLNAPVTGPFPSDWFTMADTSHNTGRRVSLPVPDCETRRSDCEDIAVLNSLDGFNLQPRLSVPFSGSIDANSVTSDTVFLVSLGSTLSDEGYMPAGTVVGINQVVWDTFTTTLHIESDALLAQHTRFALIVTRGVRDAGGAPVEASEAFRRFRQLVRGEYKQALLDAIHAARRVGVRERDIAVASVFTTQSATAVLEKMRDQIRAATPEPADFLLGPQGERTVFSLAGVTGIRFDQQTAVDPSVPTSVNLNLSLIRDTFPGAVGRLAFGKYLSPDYQVHPGEYIPPVGTRTGTPTVQGVNEIYFNLFLPSGPTPAGGWPVAIFGHPNGAYKEDPSLFVAGSMAAQGIATLAINAVGHGFGRLGTLTVSRSAGGPVTFSAGGRGIDQDGDGTILFNEGLTTATPRGIVFFGDGIRQTAADLMQLVRVIEVGMDVDGDGQHDLDASRIFYFGQSFGANYGTVFLAVEPGVRGGVLTVPGEPLANRQLGAGRPALGSLLDARQPSLVNSPGITALDGRAVGPPLFHENLPLRDGVPFTVTLADGTTQVVQSPVINDVSGAMAIQEVLDNSEWVSQAGSPVAYAPHLRKAPLPAVPAKSVICQFAKGDLGAPNPNTTAILRAGGLADRTLYYRHDLARTEIPSLPTNAHMFMVSIGVAAFRDIALGAQAQIAMFFASDGETIIHPQPARFFEVPIQGALPEALNYIP